VFDTEIVKQLNINCVVSIIDKWSYNSFRVKEKLQRAQIKHSKWIDLLDYDEVSIYPHLDDAHSYIKSMLADHNVLVHCQMGMSRSSSLVIAFLMKEYGMDYHKARIYAKSKRKIVQPNEGFEKDLLRF
jgi:dual specificity MAP kinase phosphatase/atypical dual specificity phosphatase